MDGLFLCVFVCACLCVPVYVWRGCVRKEGGCACVLKTSVLAKGYLRLSKLKSEKNSRSFMPENQFLIILKVKQNNNSTGSFIMILL